MKMNKVYFPIVIAVAIAVGLLLGSKLNPSTESTFAGKSANKNKLNKLIDFECQRSECDRYRDRIHLLIVPNRSSNRS